MTSLIQLNKIIAEKIRKCCADTQFEGVKVSNSELTEGIERPSFKVEFDNTTLSNLNSNYLDRSLTVRIYFFASDIKKHKVENLKVQELLESEFIPGIKLEHDYIAVNDVESNVVDSVLQTSFDISTQWLKARPGVEDAEYMEDLKFNI